MRFNVFNELYRLRYSVQLFIMFIGYNVTLFFFYLRYNVIIYSHSHYNFSYSLSMRFKNLVFSFLFCYCCSQCFGGVMYMFFARLEPLSIVLFCYCFSVLLWFLFVLIYCCFIGCIYTWKKIITQIQYLNASY